MTFCLFSCCDSVRDISNGLKSTTGNLNHLEISRAPSKSMVAYQNVNREQRLSRHLLYALSLFRTASSMATQEFPFQDACRLKIFFRNLKHLLRIKSFVSTTRNAVETQIWTAMITVLLLC